MEIDADFGRGYGSPINYKRTVTACYLSYASHAVINNLPALLFTLLTRDYGLDYERLGRLVLINFVTHFVVDALAIKFADRVGYRGCLIAAHLFAALGLALFGFLPLALSEERIYAGLCLAVAVFSIGGGLIQVLVSPVVDQISGHIGAGAMTLLHSFYPWGTVITVICSTVALQLLPDPLWYAVPLLWMALPLVTACGFATAPMAEPRMREENKGISGLLSLRELMRTRGFWPAVGLMAFAGATEASMAQWSSAFAEREIGVNKLTGDLLGPCVCALLMALIRMTYGKWEHKFPLDRFLLCGAVGSATCFAVMALSPNPAVALVACTLSGLTISMLWPGTVYRSAADFPKGGTGLFGMLALGGDLGCSVGPWLLGAIGKASALKFGILTGAAFPLGFALLLLAERKRCRGVSFHVSDH